MSTFLGPLLGSRRFELVFGGEAQVRLAFPEELAHVAQVDADPLRLRVRAVRTAAVVLFGGDTEVPERTVELGGGALDAADLVSVLDADEVCATGPFREVLVEYRDVHTAKMREACRARAEPRHHRTRRQIPRRVPLLPLLRLKQISREQGFDLVPVKHPPKLPRPVPLHGW
jgi:hypothetical protein